MPRPHKISSLLREADFKEFRLLMADRRCTITFLWNWLTSRGYQISRGAVHAYKASVLGKRLSQEETAASIDPEMLKRKIRKLIGTLPLDDLQIIHFLAVRLGEKADSVREVSKTATVKDGTFGEIEQMLRASNRVNAK